MVFIKDGQVTREYYTNHHQQAICAMEYIYFARPDSVIHDVCVHTARKRSGEILAHEAPCPQADLVIGVPNSSLSAAMGYAEASGLPNEMGLVKNQYIGRTFIQPTQAERRQGVRMKLSAVRKIVEGKSIVMVDDSKSSATIKREVVRVKCTYALRVLLLNIRVFMELIFRIRVSLLQQVTALNTLGPLLEQHHLRI